MIYFYPKFILGVVLRFFFFLFFLMGSLHASLTQKDLNAIHAQAGKLPFIQIDTEGKALAIWVEKKTPFYATFNKTWSPTKPLSRRFLAFSLPSFPLELKEEFALAMNAKNQAILVLVGREKGRLSLFPLVFTNDTWKECPFINTQERALPKVSLNDEGFASLFWEGGLATIELSTQTVTLKGFEAKSYFMQKPQVLSLAPDISLVTWKNENACLELAALQGEEIFFSSTFFRDFQEEESFTLASCPGHPQNKLLAVRATSKPSLEYSFLPNLEIPLWEEAKEIPQTNRGEKISSPLAMLDEKETAIVVWIVHAGKNQRLMAAFFEPNRGWSEPTNLCLSKNLQNLQLLREDKNKALLLWESEGNPRKANIIFPELYKPVEAGLGASAPPTVTTAKQILRRYPGYGDLVNILEFSVTDPSSVSSFKIYRDSATNLIKETSEFSYEDHQRPKDRTTTYYVTCVGTNGTESAATVVSISPLGKASVESITGNTGGAVRIDPSRNINIQGSSGQISVTGDPATNTLTLGLAGGSMAIDSLTPDPGTTPVFPNASGDVRIEGGTNITTAGSTNTVTFNLDSDISLDSVTASTSITSPTYTTSGADTDITAASNQNIVMQMGDAAGSNKVSFTDNTPAEVASIDSDGTLSSVEYTSVGASSVLVSAPSSQNVVVKMGDAAAANKVSFTDSADAEVASINSDGAIAGSSVTATTSVTSPTYTTSGADTDITAASNQNIVMKMGDAAAANKVSFTDSADAEVASINSDGAIAGSSVTATTSVTSPTYTSSGTDTDITAASNQNIVMKMGDAAASNKVSFTDSADAEVASLDSDGTLSSVEYTSVGANSVLVSAPASQDVVVKMGDAAGSNKISFTDSADAEVVSIDSEGVSIFTNYINYGAPRYALLKDEKPSGTSGGDFNSGAWRTRDLNTEIDPDGIVTLNTSTSQFTLETGTYYVWISCPAFSVRSHQAKLVSDPSGTPSDALIGSSAFTRDGTVSGVPIGMQSFSVILGIITPSISTTYEVQHQCGATKTGNGFGVNTDFGVSQIYTQVFIQKLSD